MHHLALEHLIVLVPRCVHAAGPANPRAQLWPVQPRQKFNLDETKTVRALIRQKNPTCRIRQHHGSAISCDQTSHRPEDRTNRACNIVPGSDGQILG